MCGSFYICTFHAFMVIIIAKPLYSIILHPSSTTSSSFQQPCIILLFLLFPKPEPHPLDQTMDCNKYLHNIHCATLKKQIKDTWTFGCRWGCPPQRAGGSLTGGMAGSWLYCCFVSNSKHKQSAHKKALWKEIGKKVKSHPFRKGRKLN